MVVGSLHCSLLIVKLPQILVSEVGSSLDSGIVVGFWNRRSHLIHRIGENHVRSWSLTRICLDADVRTACLKTLGFTVGFNHVVYIYVFMHCVFCVLVND